MTTAETAEADAADDDAEDTTAAPVEFDNFDSLDAGQMSRLLLAAIMRPEAADQAKSLIDRKRQYEVRYEQERQEAEKRFAAAGGDPASFNANDSICRQVSNREPALRRFAVEHDVIVFVSGRKSSNGKALFSVVQEANPRAYFVENEAELDLEWFAGLTTVGICGATSTPLWLMRRVADHLDSLPELLAA